MCLSPNGLNVLEIINENYYDLSFDGTDNLIFEKYFNKNKIKLFKTNVYKIERDIKKFDISCIFKISASPHTEIWKFVKMEKLKNRKKIVHFESEANNLIEITVDHIEARITI